MAEATTTSIEAAFAAAKQDGRAALMPYLMGGFPEQETATAVAEAYADSGAEGFVYLVSTVGVTGERDELPAELNDLILATKDEAGVPVAVGFGISTPEQAPTVGKVADGVIVGTRLVRAVADAAGTEAAVS